jgi:hypothetical protein
LFHQSQQIYPPKDPQDHSKEQANSWKTRKPDDLLPSSQSLEVAKEMDQRLEGTDMMQRICTEASSFSLSGGIVGTNKTLTRSLGHTSTTELEAPKNTMEAETPQRQVYQTTTPSVYKESLGTNSPS